MHRKGAADLHGLDDEIFLVLSGAAQVTLGGDVTDGRAMAANETRGTTIASGKTWSVGAGDLISIPRGSRIRWTPAGATFFTSPSRSLRADGPLSARHVSGDA